MKINIGRLIDIGYACLYPIFWSLAIVVFSGDLGSFENTQYLSWWLISWFTLLSPVELTIINLYARKFGHAFFYGMQFFLWFSAFHGNMALGRRVACLYSLGLCLILAIVDEGRQSFYPSRGPSFWDLCLDMSGVGLAAVITLVFWNPEYFSQNSPISKTRLL
jgi:VanZ family protein